MRLDEIWIGLDRRASRQEGIIPQGRGGLIYIYISREGPLIFNIKMYTYETSIDVLPASCL